VKLKRQKIENIKEQKALRKVLFVPQWLTMTVWRECRFFLSLNFVLAFPGRTISGFPSLTNSQDLAP